MTTSAHRPELPNPEGSPFARPGRRLWPALLAAALLAVASLSCSVGELLVGRSGPVVPTATKTPWPTFTPGAVQTGSALSSEAVVRGVMPPGVTPAPLTIATTGAQGSTNLVLFATETPIPTDTPGPTGVPTPTPTGTVDVETNRPTPAVGPRALPTPYVVVKSATLNGRRGPALTFDAVGQAKVDDTLAIMARTTDGSWWQVCCLANQPVWVAAELVEARGPLDGVPVIESPPTPTPRPPPPPTIDPGPQPTALPPFDVAQGPEYPIKRDNGILTIWVKVYEGLAPYHRPLPGYVLKVSRDGVDVSSSDQSFGNETPFDKTAPSEGSREYNLKFERNDAGEAVWQIYLARPNGFRVSPIREFTTTGDSYRNLVVYIAYWLAR